MHIIQIAKGLTLPADIVTQVEVILAKRRAGKSYTMRRLVEQLLQAGQQVVMVDPKGDQWGLRSSADGKRPGFPILILGGEHGDLPLEASGGEVVARLVVEERVSVLLDLSQFRKHEVATFMTAFLENLYRLKAQEKYRTPVKLVVDEADAIAPQKPQKGEERMLGAIEDIVRRGGQRGIGCTLVTQRSAVLNKNVLTQAQMLVVLRTIAPQDIAAMKAWIDVHGTAEEGRTLIESLPSLPIGDAWFWSPGWPTDEGIFKRVHVLPIDTFDSGATPKPGQKQVIPKNLADVDLEALKGQMTATIEKKKQEDPKLLRAEVVRLTRELEKKSTPVVIKNTVATKVQRIEVPAVGKRALEGLQKSEKEMRRMLKVMKDYVASTERAVETLGKQLEKVSKPFVEISGSPVKFEPRESRPTPVSFAPMVKGEPVTVDTSAITGPEQRVLNGIAWMEQVGVVEPVKEIVAFLSGYAHLLSKGFTVPCGALRTRGLVSYPAPGKIALTNAGRLLAQFPESVGTTEQMHQMVLDRLDNPKRRVLKPLLAAYPNDMSAEELCQAASYQHPLSKGFTVPRGTLRTFGLVEYPSPGRIKASSILFL